MGQHDIEEIQEAARTGYDMRARLAGMSPLRKTVTIYTDVTLGDTLGYAEDEEYLDGLKTGRRLRKGLIGELDELKERAARTIAASEAGAGDSKTLKAEALKAEADSIGAEITAVQKKIAALRKKLEKSAMVFELRSVPEDVIRGARRKARKHLGIKNKGIPDELQDEYNLEFICQMLVVSTTAWEDKLVGEKFTSINAQQARDMEGFLPRGQFPRLDAAMVELSFESAIGNAAVDNVDF